MGFDDVALRLFRVLNRKNKSYDTPLLLEQFSFCVKHLCIFFER
jgi:hypothetical protein